MICVLASGLIFLKPIVLILIRAGILNRKYEIFLQQSESSSSLGKAFVVAIPFLILVLCYGKMLLRNKQNNMFIMIMSLLGLLFNIVNAFYGTVGRMGVFFGFWQIIFISECYKCTGLYITSKSHKVLIRLAFVIGLSLYWYYTIVLRNFGDTYPYVSETYPWLNFGF